jgi:hypothetical protein
MQPLLDLLFPPRRVAAMVPVSAWNDGLEPLAGVEVTGRESKREGRASGNQLHASTSAEPG